MDSVAASLCVVIPCYNEARRLPGDAFLAFLAASPQVHFCFVDDGSTDGTLAVLNALQAKQPDRIHVRRLPVNRGKAAAVRDGVLHVAKIGYPITGYWDADLSTPLDEILYLLEVLDAQPACMLALGSRVKRLGSIIERRLVRHVLGRLFAGCATGMLGVPVYDSQCGAKLLRVGIVPVLFKGPFLTRWLFDLEMLVRLQQAGMAGTAIEVPLRCWREVSGSKLKVTDMVAVPIELLTIRNHYRVS